MSGQDQFEVPESRWDFLVERLNKIDNRLNKIDNRLDKIDNRLDQVDNRLNQVDNRLNQVDNRLSSLENAQKHAATKMWVVGTGLTTIVVLTGLSINLLNYLKP